MSVLASTIAAFALSVAWDVRKDFYEPPPIEAKFRNVADLGDGVIVRLVGAGSVDSSGRTRCWNLNGVVDQNLTRRTAELIKSRNRARFVPEGSLHRFVVYTTVAKPNPKRNFTLDMGSQFMGFWKEGGQFYGSRVILNSGRSDELGIFVDKIVRQRTAPMPCRVGQSISLGRGSLTISRIKDLPSGRFDVSFSGKGEVFGHIMAFAIGKDGRHISIVDREGKPTASDNIGLIRNGIGRGGSVRSPVRLEIDRSYVEKLSIDAPYVRRYALFGVPANPRSGSSKKPSEPSSSPVLPAKSDGLATKAALLWVSGSLLK